MAYQASDVVDKFRSRFGDVSEAAALKLLNEAAQEILFYIPYQRRQVELNLTAGTKEYLLDGLCQKVWSARYVEGSGEGAYRELTATSTDRLDADAPGWRGLTPGPPATYYIVGNALLGAGAVGFHPTPDATTQGGYPIAILDVSTVSQFTSFDQDLPDIPLAVDAFVDLMCFKRAKDAKVEAAATWKALSDESLARSAEMFWGRNPRTPQTVAPVVRQSKSWRGNNR